MTTRKMTLKERRRIQRRKRKLQKIMGLATFLLAICATIITLGKTRNEVECVVEVEESTPNIIEVSSITNESDLEMQKNEVYHVKCAGFVTTNVNTTQKKTSRLSFLSREVFFPLYICFRNISNIHFSKYTK